MVLYSMKMDWYFLIEQSVQNSNYNGTYAYSKIVGIVSIHATIWEVCCLRDHLYCIFLIISTVCSKLSNHCLSPSKFEFIVVFTVCSIRVLKHGLEQFNGLNIYNTLIIFGFW